MTSPAYLSLLGRLHELVTQPAQAGLVIPCTHAELDRDLEVLEAATRRLGGRFLNLSPHVEWEEARGPISEKRRGIVSGLLSGSPDTSLSNPEFQVVDDRIRLSFSGTSTSEEESLTPVVRLATMMVSEQYDQTTAVVIAVPDDVADHNRGQALWSLLTCPVEDLTQERLVVLPIVGASRQLEKDFQRRPSVQYMLRSDRMIHRSRDVNLNLTRAILDKPRDRPIVLFLGAGASASSGVRLGNYYRDLALNDLLNNEVEDSQENARNFYDYVNARDRFMAGEDRDPKRFADALTLERVLRESFHERGHRPRMDLLAISELDRHCREALEVTREGRLALRDLASALSGRLVIATVNFDQLAESDLGVPTSVLYLPEHFERAAGSVPAYLAADPDHSAVPILKLHGSIEDVDSLIANLDETTPGLDARVQGVLDELVRARAGEDNEVPLTWVWVGCSMRDRDVNQWLKGLPPRALEEWWVDPAPGASLDEFINENRLPRWRSDAKTRDRQLTDRLIVEMADQFLRDLADSL